MSQHDYVIENAGGATVRADINSVLAAIQSNNSGAVAPSATTAGMLWLDTPASGDYFLKVRDKGNNNWLTLGTVSDPGSDGNIGSPAGHVIKVVSASIDTQSQTTMTTGDTYYTITACTAAITPHVTGSKILVTIFANISDSSGTGSDAFSGAGIIRTGPSTASSPLGVVAGSSMRGGWIRYTEDDGSEATYPVMVSWVDTAQDDSTSHVYTLQFKSVASGHKASLNRRYSSTAYSGVSTVTLMEIAV